MRGLLFDSDTYERDRETRGACRARTSFFATNKDSIPGRCWHPADAAALEDHEGETLIFGRISFFFTFASSPALKRHLCSVTLYTPLDRDAKSGLHQVDVVKKLKTHVIPSVCLIKRAVFASNPSGGQGDFYAWFG